MFHFSFRINAFSRYSAFALLLVLALARPPIVAAEEPKSLQRELHEAEGRAEIRAYRDAIRQNMTYAGARSHERPVKETPQQTKVELAQQARGFYGNPVVVGMVVKALTVKALTDMDAIKSLFKPLSPQEDYGPWLGAPAVPATCATPPNGMSANPLEGQCRKCFTRAHAELDTVRRRFDYVQRLYRSGMEHMKALISFGESARNASLFANMATRQQALALAANADQIRASYDRAYDRLLSQLKTALDHVSECEERKNDWYNRYGFVLYQSFAMHYKRTD